jgi:hypothetical protein
VLFDPKLNPVISVLKPLKIKYRRKHFNDFVVILKYPIKSLSKSQLVKMHAGTTVNPSRMCRYFYFVLILLHLAAIFSVITGNNEKGYTPVIRT